jgi:hypothetical protein
MSDSACWRLRACSETPASRRASASSPLYRLAENIGFAAVVVAELELRQVQWKVLLTDVVEAAHDPALQERPERFDVVGMNLTAHVFALRVRDGFVAITELAKVLIAAPLVSSDQINLVADGFADEPIERSRVCLFDHLADHVAFATNRADNGSFAAQAGNVLLLIPVAVLIFSIDAGFINFNDAHKLAELRVLHGRAQAHAHVPSGLVGCATNLALNLHRANAFLGVENLPENLEPSLERVFGVLEDCPADDAETIVFAKFAKPVKRPRDEFVGSGITATRAFHYTILPAPFEQELLAGFVRRKTRHQFAERHHA